MAKITSTLFRIAGTVAYADNSISHFHVQLDDHNIWSMNQAESLECHRQIAWYCSSAVADGCDDWPFWTIYIDAVNSLGLFDFDFNENEGHPAAQKAINDMVLRVDCMYTTDDRKTHTCAAVYQDRQLISISWDGEEIENTQDQEARLLEMFQLVMDEVYLSPH